MEEIADFAAINEEHGEIENPFRHFVRTYVLEYPWLFLANSISHYAHAASIIIPPYLLGVATDVLISDSSSFSLLFVPDSMLPSGQTDQFIFVVALLAVSVCLSATLNVLDMLTGGYLQEYLPHDVRTEAYDATQRLGMEFFDSTETGNVMSVLNNDVETYSGAYESLLNYGSWWSLRIGGAFVIMFLLHWQFAALLLALLVPIVWLSRKFDDRITPQHAAARKETGRLNARIENSISGIQTVKTTANESTERERVENASQEHRDASWAVSKTRALYKPLTGLVTDLAAVLTFVIGAWWAVFGPPVAALSPLTIGTFVTFFFYTREFSDEFGDVLNFIDIYRGFRASANRFHGLLASPKVVSEPENPRELEAVTGNVKYDDVTFRYDGTSAPALENLSVEAAAGEYVGIVGPTGAGKSTFMKLLLRFYEPQEGSISVDGVDISELRVESLREQIGYVSQEPFLFDDTVGENIAYANRDASASAVTEAAKQANAHEFIVDLENGYDTDIGERGVKLSGGQRQRLAIARAIIKDPAILVLDEATSHVDNETETLIQEALSSLIADRTTFAIAHSLSTVRDADRILVLEDGKLVGEGTHSELLENDGLYATLWGAHTGEPDAHAPRLTGGDDDD